MYRLLAQRRTPSGLWWEVARHTHKKSVLTIWVMNSMSSSSRLISFSVPKRFVCSSYCKTMCVKLDEQIKTAPEPIRQKGHLETAYKSLGTQRIGQFATHLVLLEHLAHLVLEVLAHALAAVRLIHFIACEAGKQTEMGQTRQ